MVRNIEVIWNYELQSRTNIGTPKVKWFSQWKATPRVCIHVPFAGFQTIGFSAAKADMGMKNWILLDSESSVNLFCNPELVKNIKEGKEVIALSTNAGNLKTNKTAILPGYGKVWYSDKPMTNVFSLANMEKKYQVTFDSKRESAFTVHTDIGDLAFTLLQTKIPKELPSTGSYCVFSGRKQSISYQQGI
jgi:hypothetical protein